MPAICGNGSKQHKESTNEHRSLGDEIRGHGDSLELASRAFRERQLAVAHRIRRRQSAAVIVYRLLPACDIAEALRDQTRSRLFIKETECRQCAFSCPESSWSPRDVAARRRHP